MKLSPNEYELIDRYLDGQLQEQELKAFESRMENDKSFSEQVSLQKAANHLLLENGLHELRKKLDDYTPPSTFNFKNLLIIISMLASIGTIVWLIGNNNDKSVLNSHQISVKDSSAKKIIGDSTHGENLQLNHDVESSRNQKHKTVDPQKQESDIVSNIDSDVTGQHNDIKPDHETLHKKDSIAEVVENKKSKLPKNICDDIDILFDAHAVASCVNEMNGMIQFNTLKIKGGKGPYYYSIDNGRNYQSSGLFDELSSRNYELLVKDANGCISKEQRVFVSSKTCIKEKSYGINPDAGEVWPFPDGYSNCNLYIYDQSGSIVYQTVLHSGHGGDWNGISSQGKALGMGQYLYTVECKGELQEKGYITIIR